MTVHDDTHTTLGRSFSVPAHPDLLMALGRALWSFQALEGTVTVILSCAGTCTLTEARLETAGGKKRRLVALRQSLEAKGADAALLTALDGGIAAFGRSIDHRNRLSHIFAFTAGTDEHGNYLPGVAHATRSGEERTLAEKPDQLLDIAQEIEEALDPLGNARAAIEAAFPRVG